MLPVISAAPSVISVASAIGASAVNNWRALDPKTRKIATYALGGTAVIVGGRAAYKAFRKSQLLKQVDKPEVQQALAFQQGLDPYDMFGLGTDEKLIMNTATEVTNWPAVIQAYKTITGGDLLMDLKGDLSNAEYSKLTAAISTSKDAQKGIVKTEGEQAIETGGQLKPGYNDAPNLHRKVFISNQEFFAFREPAHADGGMMERSDAYSWTLAPAGRTLGFGTGRTYVGKATDGSPFIMVELYFVYTPSDGSSQKTYKFWVSIKKTKMMDKVNQSAYPWIDHSYISKEW